MDLTKEKKDNNIKLFINKSGSFTVDSNGNILSSTLPVSLSEQFIENITQNVLETFSTAHNNGLILEEIVIQFSGLKIVAREMRGSALIHLTPLNP
jgi:hypothetical protein